MKTALALLVAGVITLPGAASEAPAPAPAAPYFDATPLCHDGELVGVQIQTNAPASLVVTWPPNICAARST